LVDNIQEDDNVEFEVEQGKRGLNAVNVTKV
jgi:cold shock CspA family protein